MTKQEKNRFKELKRKVGDGDLTDNEKWELLSLYEKQTIRNLKVWIGLEITSMILLLISGLLLLHLESYIF